MVFSTLKCGCGLMDIYKTLKTESHFWLQGGERSLFLPLFYQEFIKHDNLTRLTNVHLWPWGKNFLCPTQKSPRRAWVFWGSGSERYEVKLEGAKRWKECNHSPRAGGALRVASPLPRIVMQGSIVLKDGKKEMGINAWARERESLPLLFSTSRYMKLFLIAIGVRGRKGGRLDSSTLPLPLVKVAYWLNKLPPRR